MRLLSTVVKFIGLGPALLSSQLFSGVEAYSICCFSKPQVSGTIQDINRRKLEEDSPAGLVGHIVMGHYCDDEGIFVATNATNFPQGVTNGALRFTISDTEECNSDALDRALEFQLEKAVTYEINELGMIEGSDGGWFAQAISELQGNSTLPVSLAELVRGSESEYSLAVYLLSSDDTLLGCASLKKHDEGTAAQYYELLNADSQEAVKVKEAPSSGSKIGLFVSAIAAVGIAFVMGDVLAL